MKRVEAGWAALGTMMGLGLAWTFGLAQPPNLRALGGGDRWNERAMATGAVSVQVDKNGSLWTQDAVYYLNKSTGHLLASIPDYKQSVNSMQVLSDFAERDLVSDFGLGPGSNAHFLMTTIRIGTQGQGWDPLIVVETESGQIATYRAQSFTTSGSSRPQFQLVDRRTDPRLARTLAESAAAREPR